MYVCFDSVKVDLPDLPYQFQDFRGHLDPIQYKYHLSHAGI